MLLRRALDLNGGVFGLEALSECSEYENNASKPENTKQRGINMNLPSVFLSIAAWSSAFALPFAFLVTWDARKTGEKGSVLPK